jgi:transposase-like protein
MESYNIRQLSKQSGYSKSKLARIKNFWLSKKPPEITNYKNAKYIIYDATYFHKDGCLVNIMNARSRKVIAQIYVNRECFKDVYPWFLRLKDKGLNPEHVTMDGERSIIRALKLTWPDIQLQRCLYHIEHEGLRWLRTYPKTDAGKDLRKMLRTLSSINTIKERNDFIESYRSWLSKYKNFVMSLSRDTIAFKDLQRTITLINNALPDMFRYLTDKHIHKTTNALEGFHSRLKTDYQRHRGLTRKHRINYIYWYCYFKNNKNSNTF